MTRGFLTIVGIFAHFANPFFNEVLASPTQGALPKMSLRSAREEVQPNRRRCTLWPGGAVVYQLHINIGCPVSYRCKLIMEAFEQYEENTCVRFKERSGERDYVNIVNMPDRAGCATLTGRIGGTQTVQLGTLCWHRRHIMHELGHSVGLPDEITRPDRDEWVEINFNNINPDNYYTFRKEHPAFPEVMTVPFDYYSIMMYGSHADAISPNSPTLISKKERETIPLFRDKNVLSNKDKLKISALYKCKGTDQNPEFPFDVRCSFDDGMCGFKELDDAAWHRRPMGRRNRQTLDKYVRVDFKKDNPARARLASVNFHGLSPLDKVRGPKGCVTFSYYITSDKTASFKLSLTKLNSPHQLEYGRHSTSLWEKSCNEVDWTTVSIPVTVTKPFVLVFQAQFKKGATEGAIGFGDFQLSYSPCSNPTDIPSSSSSLISTFSNWSPFSRNKSSMKSSFAKNKGRE